MVSRHGPMVLGVCRLALRDEHDVEDAFQATFLVLVRRRARSAMASVWATGFTGSLIGGSRRGPTRPGHAFVNRPESRSIPPSIDRHHSNNVARQFLTTDELVRLPDSLRVPTVLCYLKGCLTTRRPNDWDGQSEPSVAG